MIGFALELILTLIEPDYSYFLTLLSQTFHYSIIELLVQIVTNPVISSLDPDRVAFVYPCVL